MICPNCDHILGGGRCQQCGWTTSDQWPAHRMMANSPHPLKDRSLYPPATIVPEPAEVPVVDTTHKEIVNTVLAEIAANSPELPAEATIVPEPIADRLAESQNKLEALNEIMKNHTIQ